MDCAPDDQDEDGPWGVYEIPCRSCGRTVVHVCTVASIDLGYTEGVADDFTCLCSICAFNQRKGALN